MPVKDKLTDREIRAAKPREKRYELSDGACLYLEIMTNGSKFWRFRSQGGGRVLKRSLGQYSSDPTTGVSLKEARVERDNLLKAQEQGNLKEVLNPSKPAELPTFEQIARDWYTQNADGWAPGHATKVLYRMERFLLAPLGQRPIGEIREPDLLGIIRAIEANGNLETARRVRQVAGMIFRFGVVLGVCERDVAWALKDVLKAKKTQKHYKALTKPEEIADLLRKISSQTCPCTAIVKAAVLFSFHVFMRPGEIRTVEWSEIDFEKALWEAPAEKMKKGRLHIVPLSKQAIEILQSLRPLTGHGRFVFPNSRNLLHGDRPMSGEAVRKALQAIQVESTAHGVRTTASTILNESGLWDGDLIELQLAHAERNSVRAAYNRAQRLDERRKMMQWWSDWLDNLTRQD
ncbi:MAG: tyrosine-type recombinase/integrase [Synergistaceae bacterium]|nr:tyrosine-type recombinase/integrase [Synergistaceae bacterium]